MSDDGNVIVYGVRRTGTSLFMAIIANDKRLKLNNDENKLSSNDYKDLQPFYYEGPFVGGINSKNEAEYIALGGNNLIKMMSYALSVTPIEHIRKMRKIFVMNRNWVDQNNSALNLNLINIKNEIFHKNNLLYSCIKDKVKFMKEFRNEDGIEYGFNYSNLLLDMAQRDYISKVVVINFESLYTTPEYIRKYLKFHGIKIDDGMKLVNKKVSKYQKDGRENLTEFKEGYFDYLDNLHNALSTGVIDQNIINQVIKWIPVIQKNVEDKLAYLREKYNISFDSI